MSVLFASPGLEAVGIPIDRIRAFQSRCRESLATNREFSAAVDAETAVRIVPLGASLPGCLAIFFEVLTRRDPVSAAVQRYGLTKRETDVLKRLIKNESSAEMARSLCVAECTIGDHVKSIMRKFNVTKRAAVYSKIYAGEDSVMTRDVFRRTG